ncbi:uncharacterized protein LOC110706976 [Chenopodium quinoa]|uniref:uncharacterized protein LOC110706976 n=1 Tax=Chenopodium quinoa TaxID=63459 RepID=UPI000B791CFC|nr:uncharacterized protein LOC110706976 [Chenopodium quinoa]
MEEGQDSWTSVDKLYHIIFCFSLTLLFSLLISLTHSSFLRSRSLFFAASLSLLAGAAKEAADHLGFFRSSGASAKDAVADVIGVVIACFLLSLSKFFKRKSKIDDDDPIAGIALV